MRLRSLLVVSLGLFLGCAHRYQPHGRPVPYEGFYATFPSGLRLVVYEVPQVDRFAVTVSYGSGSAEDPAGKEGLAHVAEHVAFRARPAWGGDGRIWDRLIAAGFRFNAQTGLDATDYWSVGKAGDLRTALLLEAARMRAPLAGVSADDFSIERDVVVSEHRERFETDPDGAQLQRLLAEAFPDHAYGRPVAGTPESLRTIALGDVRAWTAQRYVPPNAVIVVIAPRKAREVAELVLQAFGELAEPGSGVPVEPVVRSVPGLPPSPEGDIVPATLQAPVPQPVVWVAWPVPGERSRREPQGHAAAAALDAAFAGKLATAYLGTSYQVVEGFGAFYVPFAGAGLVVMRVELARAGDAGKIVDLVKSAAFELRAGDDLTGQGSLPGRGRALTDQGRTNVILHTRDQLLVGAYLDLERIDGGRVASFLRATGEPDYLAGWQRNVAAQLKFDVNVYASEFLRRERAVAVVVTPDANGLARAVVGRAAAGEAHDALDASGDGPAPDAAEALAAARAPGLDGAARRVLPNGLTVVVARRGTLPVARVALVVRTTADGAAGAPGLGTLASWSGFALFAAHDAVMVGGDASTRLEVERVLYAQHGSSANLDVLLEATAEWARDQRARWFDEAKDVVTRRAARLDVDPDTVAARALRKALFPGHPYGRAPTAESIRSIHSGDVDDWLSEEIRPERSTLVVVSDQDPSPELWTAIEGHFGGWRRGGAPRVEVAAPPLPAVRRVLLVDRPGASQAVMVAGLRAPPLAARDAAAHEAVEWILENRLTDRLRVQQGVSYGVAVETLDLERGAALLVGAAVDRDAAASALGALLAAPRALAEAPLFPADAARARWQVARATAFAYDTTADVAAALTRLATYRLPPDHYDRQPASIAALDPARIQAAAAALAVGREAVVVAGDAKLLRPQLEKAGYAVEAP
jgi:zinc protease